MNAVFRITKIFLHCEIKHVYSEIIITAVIHNVLRIKVQKYFEKNEKILIIIIALSKT